MEDAHIPELSTYQGSGSGKKILIIEDDEELRAVMAEILIFHGFRVMTLAYALDLVRIAKSLQPDLILMDYLLPGVTGAELYMNLKADPVTFNIPVVICSAYDLVDLSISDYPRDAFISKPFEMDNLMNALNTSLNIPGK